LKLPSPLTTEAEFPPTLLGPLAPETKPDIWRPEYSLFLPLCEILFLEARKKLDQPLTMFPSCPWMPAIEYIAPEVYLYYYAGRKESRKGKPTCGKGNAH
jgi:hypothetical protein